MPHKLRIPIYIALCFISLAAALSLAPNAEGYIPGSVERPLRLIALIELCMIPAFFFFLAARSLEKFRAQMGGW